MSNQTAAWIQVILTAVGAVLLALIGGRLALAGHGWPAQAFGWLSLILLSLALYAVMRKRIRRN